MSAQNTSAQNKSAQITSAQNTSAQNTSAQNTSAQNTSAQNTSSYKALYGQFYLFDQEGVLTYFTIFIVINITTKVFQTTL